MKRMIAVCATCGVGKSTVVDILAETDLDSSYVFLDSDNVGLNWHDYEDLPDGNIRFFEDCIAEAVIISQDKHIVFATCMNPNAFGEMTKNEQISETHFLNLICNDEVLTRRLKGRPKERMTHSDEFISGQIDYMNWFRNNSNLMDKVIDSSEQSIEETAEAVEGYIRALI